MSNNNSNALIQQLLKAEQEAEEIIKKAKDARTKLLNEADIIAQKEIEQFKKLEEEALKEKLKALPCENDSTINKVREETEQMIAKYRQKASAISESLVNLLVTNVTTVNLPEQK